MKRKIKLRDMTWDECCAIGKECEKEGRALSYHGVTFSPEEAYRLKILLPKEMMDEDSREWDEEVVSEAFIMKERILNALNEDTITEFFNDVARDWLDMAEDQGNKN